MPEESLGLVAAAFCGGQGAVVGSPSAAPPQSGGRDPSRLPITLLSLLGAVRHLFQALRGEPANATFDLAFPETSFPNTKHWRRRGDSKEEFLFA